MNAKLNKIKLIRSILHGLWIFGAGMWVAVMALVLDPITAPYQFAPLSRYVPLPTDFVGVAGFVLAFFAFVAWKYLE